MSRSVDNAKISTSETIIHEENSKVICVITEELDTLEKDLIVKSEISKIFRSDRDLQ